MSENLKPDTKTSPARFLASPVVVDAIAPLLPPTFRIAKDLLAWRGEEDTAIAVNKITSGIIKSGHFAQSTHSFLVPDLTVTEEGETQQFQVVGLLSSELSDQQLSDLSARTWDEVNAVLEAVDSPLRIPALDMPS